MPRKAGARAGGENGGQGSALAERPTSAACYEEDLPESSESEKGPDGERNRGQSIGLGVRRQVTSLVPFLH